MKKTVLIIFLVFLISFTTFGQNVSTPVDLIVLLDTSASMSSSFHETRDFLIGPFLREYLNLGDTFHLISFSERPRLEITRRIAGRGDLETVIARLLLMYPLDPSADLAEAIDFTERYASSLPPGRTQRIALITDGNAPNTQNLVDSFSARLSGRGAELHYIRPPAPVATRPPVQAPAPTPPAPPAPAQAAPTPAPTPPAPAAPPPAPPPTPVQTPPEPTAAAQPAPVQAAPEPAPVQAAPPPAPTPPAQPAQPVQRPPREPRSQEGIPIALLIALSVLALALLAAIVAFAVKRLQQAPNRFIAKATIPVIKAPDIKPTPAFDPKPAQTHQLTPTPRKTAPLPKDKVYKEPKKKGPSGDPIMLNLFVADQNTAIGRRNIHSVKPGFTFTIGGGKSDFLIFLVPIPFHIADIFYDGKVCTLTPRMPEYFPDLGANPVPNCIGKNIRVVSEKKYELHIRIERFEDPLIVLNQMLNSITVPGLNKK